MTEYLIAFNDEWVPDHTDEELREKSKAVRALVAEMKAAGVLIFTGGLDDAAPVFSVDTSSGTPLFTDGPFIETKEQPRWLRCRGCSRRAGGAAVGGKDRGGLRLAAGGTTLPGPHATSRELMTDCGRPAPRLFRRGSDRMRQEFGKVRRSGSPRGHR
jgi:hypothetical protein